MRSSCLLVFLLVIFATSCYGLISDNLGNDQVGVTHEIPEKHRRHLRTPEGSAITVNIRGEENAKHSARGLTENSLYSTKATDAQNEERGVFDLSKRKSPVFKSQSSKTLSQKNTLVTAAEKSPYSSKVMNVLGKSPLKLTEKDASFFKINPAMEKLNVVLAKNPSKVTETDIELMGQTPGLSRAKMLLGKDPPMATQKDLKRVGTYLSKNRGNPKKYWVILYGLICLSVLGVIFLNTIAFV